MLREKEFRLKEEDIIMLIVVGVVLLMLLAFVLIPNMPRINTLGGRGERQNTLCGCGRNILGWLFACCCPCIVFGRNVERMEGESCFPLCAFYLCGMGTGMSGVYRSNVYRQTSGDNPGHFVNVTTHLLCYSCALAQESRAMDLHNINDDDGAGTGAAARGPAGDQDRETLVGDARV